MYETWEILSFGIFFGGSKWAGGGSRGGVETKISGENPSWVLKLTNVDLLNLNLITNFQLEHFGRVTRGS